MLNVSWGMYIVYVPDYKGSWVGFSFPINLNTQANLKQWKDNGGKMLLVNLSLF